MDYGAVRALTGLKAEYGFLPRGLAMDVCRRIDDALAFGAAVREADDVAHPDDRRAALAALAPEILRRNRETFFSGVANQSFPINRAIGGRWFDETLHPEDVFERASESGAPASSAV